ncbi:unnamed protein product [Prorocentrum cordatum]|uniref:Uncharacterized protein n=1 Tax=Prorocentrum cordatum TaxID=2364126 RepID=A0ABN9XGF5_9DINO|nr:unnamed protein product [Polarella glacialis]
MVVQAEKAQISMFEITVWASVDLSCLPTASMPASLMFLLKLMCITDTFNVEGNSMVFRELEAGGHAPVHPAVVHVVPHLLPGVRAVLCNAHARLTEPAEGAPGAPDDEQGGH